MIRINLLPRRYRKIRKVSKAGLIFAGLVPVVFGILLTYYLVQRFVYLVPLGLRQQELAADAARRLFELLA